MKTTHPRTPRIALLAVCAFIAAAFALRASAQTKTPLVNLAHEDAAFVLIMKDVPSIANAMKDSPLAKMIQSQEMNAFFAPALATFNPWQWDDKVKAKTGLTINEIIDLAQGDYLVSLKDVPTESDSIQIENLPYLLAVEIGDNKAKVEKLIGSLVSIQKGGFTFAADTEDYAGNTINIIKITDKTGKESTVRWAIVDGTLIASPSKTTHLSTIDALKNGGVENAFGKSERYLRIKKQTGDAQTIYALNFAAIYPAINASLAKMANSGRQDAAMLNYTTLASTLGLDAIRDIYIGGSYNGEYATSSGAITHSGLRGLLKLLAFRDTPVKIPEYASADWPAVSVANYSIPEAFLAIEQLLEAINPGISAMAQGQLIRANETLGIDIKRDLINTIGEQIVSANVLPAGMTANDTGLAQNTGALYVIALKDARTFQNAIETVKRASGLESHPMLTQRDYLGTTVTTINNRGKQTTYAITRNHLVFGVGSPTIVEFGIQNLAKGASSPLAERADVRENFANAPANTISYGVQNTAFVMRMICDSLTLLPQAEKYVDPAAAPGIEFFEKYLGNSYGWATSESDGLYFTSKIYYKN